MNKPEFGLEWLLHPLDPSTFFTDYWEKQPLTLFRNDPSYFQGLLSLADMDHILSSYDRLYPTIKLVKNGAPVPAPQFATTRELKGVSLGDIIDPVKLFAEYQQGATIVMNEVHQSWLPLARLCASIERTFSHPTQTNVYLTPPSAKGFSAHYDTHDVFILQTVGSKRWRLYGSKVQLPLANEPYPFPGPDPGTPTANFVLNAGDVLYLPRGYVHDAVTSDSVSLHVTLGINTYNWADIFMEAFEALCKRDVRFRRSLPIGFAVDPAAADRLRAEAMPLVQALATSGLPIAEIADRCAERFIMSRPALLDGHLTGLASACQLTPQSRVRKRAWIWKLTAQGDSVRLAFHGKTLTFPRHIEPTLRYILATDEFEVTSLPGNLSEWDKIDLVQRLMEGGVLKQSDGHAAS